MEQHQHPLTRLRRERGIKSQHDLAELAGVSEGSIQKLEAGTRQRGGATMFRIAKALDLHPTDIVENGQCEIAELLR